MKILGWYCRGICNALTVRAFGAQIKGAIPDVVFHSKTKADENRLELVKNYVKFDNKCIMEAKGRAGGLCIMWKAGVSIKKVEIDKNLIIVKVSDSVID